MCWWIFGGWWPGLVLMAVFMVICVFMMAGMIGSRGGMFGFGRRRPPRA